MDALTEMKLRSARAKLLWLYDHEKNSFEWETSNNAIVEVLQILDGLLGDKYAISQLLDEVNMCSECWMDAPNHREHCQYYQHGFDPRADRVIERLGP